MKQRVLIVDDSPFIRRMLADLIKGEPDFEVVGTAGDGDEAIRLVKELRPDLVTMDVEMPRRDGLSALEEIMRDRPTAVLMVSSVTTQGAAATIRALELGAYDFVTKPQGSSGLRFIEARAEVLEKLRAAKLVRLSQSRQPAIPASLPAGGSDSVVVIAASTGGPRALQTVFESLPVGFPAPILLVQHMPPGFTASFAARLNSIGTVPVKEAQHGDRVVAGLALVARGGMHMRVCSGGTIELSEDAPIHGVRPAADPLFISALDVYGSRLVGAVLTGMGRDGAEGAVALRRRGCLVLGESEQTCTIYGMPRAAKESGGLSSEHPIDEIGRALVDAVAGRARRAS
jgi:two-component system chemotaxis response regulator CheB